MKVILLEELKGRGGEGDVIDVATGYAVNYLLPKKIAIQATRGNLKQLELRKHNIAKREAERLDTADKILAAIDGQKIRVGAKVGEEGQLFGSVTAQRVADAINERFKTSFERKRIDLQEVIKTAGEHTALISIYRDTKASVIIEVIDEKKLAELEKSAVAVVVEAEDTAELEADGLEIAEAVAGVFETGETVATADEDIVEPVEAVDEPALIETAMDAEAKDAAEAAIDEAL